MNRFGDQWLTETIIAALIGAAVQIAIAIVTYLDKMNDISKKIADPDKRLDGPDKRFDDRIDDPDRQSIVPLSEDHNNILNKVEDLWKEESGKKGKTGNDVPESSRYGQRAAECGKDHSGLSGQNGGAAQGKHAA